MKKSMEALGRLSEEAFKQLTKVPLSLALDNVRSLNNVGAIFRSADAFMLNKMVLGGFTPNPPHRDIHKTALGAEMTVAWQKEEDLLSYLSQQKRLGVKIICLEQCHNSAPMEQVWPKVEDHPCILVIGNEVNGVQNNIIALSNYIIEISQYGTKHSLNVATSASICMHDYVRRFKSQKTS